MKVGNPEILVVADALDDAGIPKGVHVGSPVEESDLGSIEGLTDTITWCRISKS